MKNQLTEIVPELFSWKSHHSGPQQPVNSYVWNAPQGVVVIDPGADLTSEALKQFGLSKVTDIFITHLQEEHVAGCSNFPDSRVHIPQGDEYLCEGAQAYSDRDTTWQPPWDWESRGNFEGHLAGARNERPPQMALHFHHTLKSGDEINGIRVLPTPGHGKNAVSLLADIGGLRVAFCGDLIFGDGQLWNWFDCDWDYGLEAGRRALIGSANALLQENPDLLLTSHGPPVHEPRSALTKLMHRIDAVLSTPELNDDAPLNFPEKDSSTQGWRELMPGLHQWKAGNCAVLISQSGDALLVDDGLCHWVPLPERAAHHVQVMVDLKRALDIRKIELVIPTHFHGDHVENIPDIVALEGAGVSSLDLVADVLEQPEKFNLSAPLPWYGTAYQQISIDRKVSDGTHVNWREYELEIFHLGGQTFYHAGIAVTINNRRVVFVGDAIFGWNVQPEPVLCFNDNDPQSRGWAYAIDRLIEREPDFLVCGHGSAIQNPMPLLFAKKLAWKQRLEHFRELSAREELRLFFDPFM